MVLNYPWPWSVSLGFNVTTAGQELKPKRTTNKYAGDRMESETKGWNETREGKFVWFKETEVRPPISPPYGEPREQTDWHTHTHTLTWRGGGNLLILLIQTCANSCFRNSCVVNVSCDSGTEKIWNKNIFHEVSLFVVQSDSWINFSLIHLHCLPSIHHL